jgi:hypothetical protein
MEKILNITNGDSAVAVMRSAGVPGEFLPWQDVLHEGPVPEVSTLEELSGIRAQFLAGQGWGTPEKIRGMFRRRDAHLSRFRDYDRVILWFEHDLFDQLQLLQILAWFSLESPGDVTLNSVWVERYLGIMKPDEMKMLIGADRPVTEAQLKLAGRAWAAFRAASSIPFLKGAVLRLLEEYPACGNGLSRTEHQALDILASGPKSPVEVFKLLQKREERVFMGDAVFYAKMNNFLHAGPPLLAISPGDAPKICSDPGLEISITETGRGVLSSRHNWLDLMAVDRWIGGVHLRGSDIWCWDKNTNKLRKRDDAQR